MSVSRLPAWAECCLLVFIASIIRLPHFFEAVIEWDESTFILMGQSIVDGHLPYVELWDNKPPLCFVPFALVIALFGKSIFAVRALGLVCVVISAWMVRNVALRFGDRSLGLVSGIACVVFVSYAPSGMATLSEHLAIVPLTGVLALALRPQLHAAGSFGAGAGLSIATLVRTNLALTALAVVGFWLLERSRTGRDRIAPIALVGGLLTPWIVCAAPYAALGLLPLFYAAVFVAPFGYAVKAVVGRMVWHLAPLGLAQLPAWWKGLPSELRRNLSFTATFALSTLASILVTGTGTLHYGVQFVPFGALMVAFAVIATMHRVAPALRYGLCAALVCGLLVLIGLDAKRAATELRSSPHSVVYGPAVEIARHIAANNPEKRPVLMFSNHLAYWFMGTQPMTKIMTHPTNVLREVVVQAVNGPSATPTGELERVFALEPLYVVRENGGKFTHPTAIAVIDPALAASYTLEAEFGGTLVYRRNDQ